MHPLNVGAAFRWGFPARRPCNSGGASKRCLAYYDIPVFRA